MIALLASSSLGYHPQPQSAVVYPALRPPRALRTGCGALLSAESNLWFSAPNSVVAPGFDTAFAPSPLDGLDSTIALIFALALGFIIADVLTPGLEPDAEGDVDVDHLIPDATRPVKAPRSR